MTRGSIAIAFAVAAAAASLLVASAASAKFSPVVADCNAHGQLTQNYTEGQLREALNTMPSDIKEYTDCFDVIQRRLLADIGGIKGAPASGGSSGSSFLPTPLLVFLAILIAAAAGFGIVALRRR